MKIYLDPNFAADRIVPDPAGLSLFTEPGDGPYWLYAPGAMELWFFRRLRQESLHTCLNAYHPGRFRTFNPVLYASRQWSFETLPAATASSTASAEAARNSSTGRTGIHEP